LTATLAGNGFARGYGAAFDYCQSGSDLTVVADRECRTNFHRTLRRGGFGVTFGLLGKINGRFVFVRFQKRRRFFKAHATHRARGVDVPGSANIQRLFTVFVRHASCCTESKHDPQLFRRLPIGITIFPGGIPLYRNGVLVGAIGISGDGVDRDDIVAASGTHDFLAPNAIRSDQFMFRGTRLPYMKFPRDPGL